MKIHTIHFHVFDTLTEFRIDAAVQQNGVHTHTGSAEHISDLIRMSIRRPFATPHTLYVCSVMYELGPQNEWRRLRAQEIIS